MKVGLPRFMELMPIYKYFSVVVCVCINDYGPRLPLLFRHRRLVFF
jgi:hypothetical protein